MKASRRPWYSLVAAIALAGCASTRDIPIETFSPPPKSEMATVYFYRDTTMPTKVNLDVSVDGEKHALLPPSRFTWLWVKTGKHLLSVGYPSFPDMSAKQEVVLESGKNYLFKYLSDSGGRLIPLIGANGITLGFINAGSKPWTLLQSESDTNISDVISRYQYVPAQTNK